MYGNIDLEPTSDETLAHKFGTSGLIIIMRKFATMKITHYKY